MSNVLVFNAGSSSLKFGVFRSEGVVREAFRGSFDRFRDGQCDFRFRASDKDEAGVAGCPDLESALEQVPQVLERFALGPIHAVGHRVAHGGARFSDPALLDDAAIDAIDALTPLAPLHNPSSLQGVRLCRRLWPDVPQVAVFDTSFHLTNPPFATTYAVAAHWRAAGLRRYGFHGTSHKYVAQRAAEEIGRPLSELRIISVHLGNGASVCAVNHGLSMDSSMGMTPLEGLVMGTRSGDLDPGAFGFLSRELGLSVAQIEDALYREGGLKGLAGTSDMRDLEAMAARGDGDAQLAIEIYAYRARKYVGAYAAVRDSGKLDGTPPLTIEGPAGRLVTNGLIIAARHLHTNPEDAERMGLENGDLVDVRVGNAERGLTFERALVRVAPGAFTEMHIDTDEANAAGIAVGAEGQLVPHEAEVIRRPRLIETSRPSASS